MTIREQREQMEHQIYSAYAAFSDQAEKTRRIQEVPCTIRTAFQRDRDRILHSKAFRRLEHKTQVFLAPEGDHYRTRLTHTLEVAQIARTIARGLRLNEDLAEAAALGHDLGHTPFGHSGEQALDALCEAGFSHSVHSLRVVDYLEKDRNGLNLTKAVRNGILCHQTKSSPATLEGKIVRLSDKIAYINHDADDAIRAGIITDEDLPREYVALLGKTVRERLNSMVTDVIIQSQGKPDICMSQDVWDAMMGLRDYMFDNVYTSQRVKGQERKAKQVISYLYQYYMKHENELPRIYIETMKAHGDTLERVVVDYIAGMTDRYAIKTFRELTVPQTWQIL